MDAFKSKIVLLFVIGLSLLQFSLAILMMHEGHQEACVFNEQCILQLTEEATKALPPLFVGVIPVFLTLVLASRVQFEKIKIHSSAVDGSLRRTLKGVIQRE